jgi:uncharacterized damage-inducible protein DinB
MVFTIDALRDLFRHMEWADGEVWRAVRATGQAHDDAAIRGWLLHLHTVQHAFLDVWNDHELRFPDPAAFPDIDQLHAWSKPYYQDAHTFLDDLTPEALAQPVVMPWAGKLAKQRGRLPGAPTLAETMVQVTSHSTYHRGQINARLRTLGGEPPLVDYIAWIWFGRPSPGAAD